MACPRAHLLLTAIVVFLHLVQSLPAISAILLHGGTRRAMVLPLYLSPPNVFRSFSNSRRHLQRPGPSPHPNARMRLYGDLLNGYYTTRLWIGTLPQPFALIVDTGNTVTYVPCATCEQCGRHQDPKFQPDSSSTYQPLKCNSDCNCDNERVQCVYDRQYAEMSSSSGVLGEDILSFGNESELVPQRAVFGCENSETGDLYSQHADGIMGLGVAILVLLTNSLIKFRDGNSPYYNIDLKALHVAGKPLPLNPKAFEGKHGTVLDSGTTYAYLPEAAFLAFKDAIMNELQSLKQIRGPDPNYNDVCFSGASSDVSQLSSTFPTVEMVFSNGQKLLLSPENYLFRHSKVRGAYCLGIFQNGKDPTTLLGGIVVRNTLVMYDREHLKIGFWKTNCSELWERLQVTATPPPVSLSSSEKNSTADSPSSKPPNFVPSGDLRIGQITFDMSLSVNY